MTVEETFDLGKGLCDNYAPMPAHVPDAEEQSSKPPAVYTDTELGAAERFADVIRGKPGTMCRRRRGTSLMAAAGCLTWKGRYTTATGECWT